MGGQLLSGANGLKVDRSNQSERKWSKHRAGVRRFDDGHAAISTQVVFLQITYNEEDDGRKG